MKYVQYNSRWKRLFFFSCYLSQALSGWIINKGIYLLKTRIQKIIHQKINYYAFWFGIGWGIFIFSVD